MSSPSYLLPHVWLFSSFAVGLRGGNPAGVVVSSHPITTQAAQAVARDLSVPTTGFTVSDEATAKGTANVRFFTPEQEIDACGHVTIAIATALVEAGIWRWGEDTLIRAPGGEFPLRLRQGKVEMEQRRQLLEASDLDWEEVEAALGSVRKRPELPLAIAGTGLRHLIVPLADSGALQELTLDGTRIAALAERALADTICVWAPGSDRNHFRMRDLCAAIGAIEEPASGTTSGALALYLAQHEQLASQELVVEQGVEMGRPSRIEVVLTSPEHVTVRGGARKVVEGTLVLPSAMPE
jgi:trans-2,3-dihydro-3-hydroxyanthranilate isomerase